MIRKVFEVIIDADNKKSIPEGYELENLIGNGISILKCRYYKDFDYSLEVSVHEKGDEIDR